MTQSKKSANKVEEKPVISTPVSQPETTKKPTPQYPIISAKCRRGSDQLTYGQSCSCLVAENLTQRGSSISTFKCTKCRYIWRVSTGGAFSI